MWIIGNPAFFASLKSASRGRVGLFLLLLYLVVFSNLPDSGILAVYAGSVLLLNGLELLKRKVNLQAFIRDNFFFVGVLCCSAPFLNCAAVVPTRFPAPV